MLLRQVFKTSEGARKHAAFETNHCGGKFFYYTVRCVGPDNQPDNLEFDVTQYSKYTWRVARKSR
jgi:hypothetical protein